MKRLVTLVAAMMCLGAGKERAATFEFSCTGVFDAQPLEVGRHTIVANTTVITSVPEGFSGWAFVSTRPRDVYNVTPRSTGAVYIAAERHLATSKEWAAWKDYGVDIGVQDNKWNGQYRVFRREATMGKRFKTPNRPYAILLVPPENPAQK